MPPPADRPICAVKRTLPAEADQVLAAAVTKLRRGGVRLAGILQHDTQRPGRRRCDMDLVDIADGSVIRISEDRGDEARGCRLKTDALAEVAARLVRRIASGVDLVVVNKFGKAEAEGRGLRDVVVAAVERGVPLIIGVKSEFVPDLLRFTGDLASIVEADLHQVEGWLSHNLARPRSVA